MGPKTSETATKRVSRAVGVSEAATKLGLSFKKHVLFTAHPQVAIGNGALKLRMPFMEYA